MANQFREQIRNVVNSHISHEYLSKKIQRDLVDLMQLVQIDRNALKEKVEEVRRSDKGDKNILHLGADALASIFGARVVRNADYIALEQIAGGDQHAFLTINENAAQEIAANITNSIDGEIFRLKQENEQLAGALHAANRELDRVRAELDELRRAQEAEFKKTLQAIQRILGQQPDLKPAEDGETNALLLYLEDLRITWSWDDKAYPRGFTTYKFSNPDQTGVRLPCLFQDGEVVLRGVKYLCENTKEA